MPPHIRGAVRGWALPFGGVSYNCVFICLEAGGCQEAEGPGEVFLLREPIRLDKVQAIALQLHQFFRSSGLHCCFILVLLFPDSSRPDQGLVAELMNSIWWMK